MDLAAGDKRSKTATTTGDESKQDFEQVKPLTAEIQEAPQDNAYKMM